MFLGAIIYVVLTRMKDGIHSSMMIVKWSLSGLNNLNRVKHWALIGFSKKIIEERILIHTDIYALMKLVEIPVNRNMKTIDQTTDHNGFITESTKQKRPTTLC